MIDNSSSPASKWIKFNGGLSIIHDNEQIEVLAADIVRIQFKGQSEFKGIPIFSKPSEIFNDIKLSRFPAKLILHLKMPYMNTGRPFLELNLEFGNKLHQLNDLPKRDQIIIDGEWFPILDENLEEIKLILLNNNISHIGNISLRQCLNLLQLKSDFIKVSDSDTTNEAIHDNSKTDIINILTALPRQGFTANLYPYQERGVLWLYQVSSEGLGCILADEMGLGKTIQIIALLTIYKPKLKLPSLIIAPATLLENWRREFIKFSNNIKVLIHSGVQRTGFPSTLKKFDVVITSYDTAVSDQGMFGMLDWGFIVLDEAQAIKNPETQRAITLKSFHRKVAISVTGTPVENRLLDLWSIMDFSCPGLLGSRQQFELNHVDSEESAIRMEKIVSPLMLRRRVSEVADDLPEKIIIPQAVRMNEELIIQYEDLRKRIVSQYGKSATIVSLNLLRQFCTHPFLISKNFNNDPSFNCNKYSRLVEILDEIKALKQKGIIFTSFIEMSDLLCNDLSIRLNAPCLQIDGRTPIMERQGIIDQFSSIKGTAFLILNPKAAGTGLNITAANHVIHYNLEWNPAVEDQGTARSHRRGQKLPVIVHRIFYSNTVEEIINDRISRKRDLFDKAVIGTEASKMDIEDIVKALSISPIINGD